MELGFRPLEVQALQDTFNPTSAYIKRKLIANNNFFKSFRKRE